MKEIIIALASFSAGILLSALFFNSEGEERRTFISFYKPEAKKEQDFIVRILSKIKQQPNDN
jgi:hypothetical protein